MPYIKNPQHVGIPLMRDVHQNTMDQSPSMQIPSFMQQNPASEQMSLYDIMMTIRKQQLRMQLEQAQQMNQQRMLNKKKSEQEQLMPYPAFDSQTIPGWTPFRGRIM